MGAFLQPFFKTFKKLAEGVNLYCKEKGQFICKAFLLCGTCDFPARAIVRNCVQYNGAYSCWKCSQTAKVRKGSCNIFPFIQGAPKFPERTKESVLKNSKEAIDKLEAGLKKFAVNGIKGPSWLCFFLQFHIIDGVGIDYMHGVLLGVQKLLITLWFSVAHKGKEFSVHNKVIEADRRLLSICPTLNITRIQRSIQNCIKYWKASAFCSFLLYFGAPVMISILDNKRLRHYLLLVNALHILLKDGCSDSEIMNAEIMLFEFVHDFAVFYHSQFMTLNVHQLVHLADCVRTLGPLYTHSCFSFEDKNGILLRMIRGTQNIDNQIITGVSPRCRPVNS